jgi:phenylacetate-CoA ligase
MSTLFDPWLLASASTQVMALGQGKPEQLAGLRQQRLGTLLHKARQGSAFYRERMLGLPEGAGALPFIKPVSRHELMAHFDQWVTDPRLRLAELQAFTAQAGLIGQPYLGEYLVWESSGTSGQPGIFVQDAQSMAVYDALESLRGCAGTGFDPFYLTERIAFVGAIDGHFASAVSFDRLRQLQPWRAMRSFSVLQPIEALCEQLESFAPTVLVSYPTAAAAIAEQCRRGYLNLHLHEVWTGGETLSPGLRQGIERAFGVRVRNNYGSSEFLSMAWQCSEGHLHLNADWVVLEPVDQNDRPVPAGEAPAAVLLTNLVNQVQPLIRYRMGDSIRFETEPCACGSSLPLIAVQGRCDDILHLRGLHGHMVPVLPLALTTVLEEEAGVFDFQIRQIDDHSLLLRLPADSPDAAHSLGQCGHVLKHYTATLGAAPVNVKGELASKIARGRSGKLCRIQALH